LPKITKKTTARARRKPGAAPPPPRGDVAPKPGALSDAAAAYAAG
jgi:hypothetical protein